MMMDRPEPKSNYMVYSYNFARENVKWGVRKPSTCPCYRVLLHPCSHVFVYLMICCVHVLRLSRHLLCTVLVLLFNLLPCPLVLFFSQSKRQVGANATAPRLTLFSFLLPPSVLVHLFYCSIVSCSSTLCSPVLLFTPPDSDTPITWVTQIAY